MDATITTPTVISNLMHGVYAKQMGVHAGNVVITDLGASAVNIAGSRMIPSSLGRLAGKPLVINNVLANGFVGDALKFSPEDASIYAAAIGIYGFVVIGNVVVGTTPSRGTHGRTTYRGAPGVDGYGVVLLEEPNVDSSVFVAEQRFRNVAVLSAAAGRWGTPGDWSAFNPDGSTSNATPPTNRY